MTWEEAVELAEKNSSELQTLIANYNAVAETEKTAWAPFLPTVTANAHGAETGSPGNASQFSYTANLALTQNLFAGLADYDNLKIKKLNTQQAALDLRQAKADLSQSLKQVFAETYYAQLNIQLVDSILKRRQEDLRSVQLQFDGGGDNKGSVLLSQSYVESALLDTVAARHSADITFENLRRLLGLAPTDAITIEKNIPIEVLPTTVPDFNAMVENQIAVVKARNDEQIAEYNVSLSKSQFSPTLDFNASYNYADTKFFPGNDNWAMGLTFSIPLFDGFRDVYSYRANKARLSSSSNTLATLLTNSLRDLKQAYYNYVESLQQEKVDTSFNQAAILRAEIARNKYKNGLISFDDWDLIESDLIVKEKNFIQSEKNRITKQSLWEKAQGIGVFK
ncbi:MAG: TolC family protein [Pseudobdellovibrio sp.]